MTSWGCRWERGGSQRLNWIQVVLGHCMACALIVKWGSCIPRTLTVDFTRSNALGSDDVLESDKERYQHDDFPMVIWHSFCTLSPCS